MSEERMPITATPAPLSQEQADALLARLHVVRRSTTATRFDAIRQIAEAIYVLAGWAPTDALSVADSRLTGWVK